MSLSGLQFPKYPMTVCSVLGRSNNPATVDALILVNREQAIRQYHG
jgi:hypothetical protein